MRISREQVAGRSAAAALGALAGDADATAVVDAGRNAQRDALGVRPSVAIGSRHADLSGGAARRFEELEFERHLEIFAAERRRAASAPPATAEHAAEHVVDVEAEGVAAHPVTAAEATRGARRIGVEASFERDRSELVVERALLRIREHRVRLRDFLEALFGFAAALVQVRVELARELAIRLADRFGVGAARDAQHFVEIATPGHRPYSFSGCSSRSRSRSSVRAQ